MADNQSTDHAYSGSGSNGLYNQDGRDRESQPSQNRQKSNSELANLEESSVEVNIYICIFKLD